MRAAFTSLAVLRIIPLRRFESDVTRGDIALDCFERTLRSRPIAPAGGRAQLTIDQLDRAWFPSAGYSGAASFYGATTAFGSAINYQRLEGRAMTAAVSFRGDERGGRLWLVRLDDPKTP